MPDLINIPTAGLPVLAMLWHESLLIWTQNISIIAIVLGMFLCILRLLRGPHLADRALAVDTLGVQLIGLVILLTMRLRTLVFFDGILVLSLLGFAGTVAIAQYIGRPHLGKSVQLRGGAATPGAAQTGGES